jgi:hypothetical protein
MAKKCGKIIKRHPLKSITARNYEKRNEIKNLLETLKPETSRHGAKFFENTLRSYFQHGHEKNDDIKEIKKVEYV